MMQARPRRAALAPYSNRRSGVRCADTMRDSYGTAQASSPRAARCITSQSLELPITIPTAVRAMRASQRVRSGILIDRSAGTSGPVPQRRYVTIVCGRKMRQALAVATSVQRKWRVGHFVSSRIGGRRVMTEPGMHKGDEFQGKVAIVTGAARNIGRAVALALAAGGAKVAVNTRANLEQAKSVAEEIKALGSEAEP